MRRRPEGLGVEGPLPLPLVYPDARGFTLGRISSNTKDMLQYQRYPRYMHLQTDKENSNLPASTRRPRQRLRSDPWTFNLANIVWKDDHFIQ